jgi:tetratricopeptide (TPR) repeat protein
MTNLHPSNQTVMRSAVLFIMSMMVPLFLGAQHDSLFRKGQNASEPSEMIKYYTESIEQEGATVCAYYYRGLAKYDLTDLQGAADDFKDAIKTESRYSNGLKYRIDLQNDYKAQKNAYILDRLDSSNTENCRKLAWYSLGNASYNLHEYLAAVDGYTGFLELESKNPEYLHYRCIAYNSRAGAYYFLKQYEKAVADNTIYMSLKPDDPNGYMNRGLSYLVLARYNDAITDFNKIILVKADYAPAYADRGYAYMQLGKTELAIGDLKQCLKIDNQTFSTNLDLVIIYYREGNMDECKKYLDLARSLEPRLATGMDAILQFETEGYFWTEKDKETLGRVFKEIK